MMIEGIGFVVIEGPYHIYMEASSVQIEYSVLACNHNYSLCYIYCIFIWYSYVSCIVLAFTIFFRSAV